MGTMGVTGMMKNCGKLLNAGYSELLNANKIWALAGMAATMMMTACHHNDDIRPARLTQQQKEEIASEIRGEYGGSYVIIWTDSTMHAYVNDEGRQARPMGRTIVEKASMTVTNGELQSVIFHRFPISELSRVVEGNEPLRTALAGAPDTDLVASYDFGLYTDRRTVVWALRDMTASLTLSLEGHEMHIVLPIDFSGTRWLLGSMDEQGDPISLSRVGSIAFTFTAIYVDGELVQQLDGSWEERSELMGVFRIGTEDTGQE